MSPELRTFIDRDRALLERFLREHHQAGSQAMDWPRPASGAKKRTMLTVSENVILRGGASVSSRALQLAWHSKFAVADSKWIAQKTGRPAAEASH
jgi:hypothetical protein